MGNIQDVYGGHSFDANEVEPQASREPLPAGWYNCMIEEVELKESKASAESGAGNAYYLSIAHRVLDGPHENRKLFQNVTLRNPSQQAEEIGMRQLSSLGRATGQMVISDTSELVEKLLQVKAKVVPPKDGFDARNEVSDVKSINGATPQPSSPAPASNVAPGSAPAAKPASALPWKRGK